MSIPVTTSKTFLASLFGLLVLLAQPTLADDPWAPGYRLDEWDRIEALQQYPLYPSAPEPDWKTLSKDSSPLVRAATALAIGRVGEAKLLPWLLSLLDDPVSLTKQCALWALLQIESPLIKEPLLKALGSWEKPEVVGWQLGALLFRVGLPSRLAGLSLPQRQAWLKKFDAQVWKTTFREWQRSGGFTDALTKITFCARRSQWDAGDPIPLRIQVSHLGDKNPKQVRIVDRGGSWIALDRSARLAERDEYDRRLAYPRDFEGRSDKPVVTVNPNQSVVLDLVVSPKGTPVPPGTYLLYAFDHLHPVLVRVRRSLTFEKTIPDLIKKTANQETVKLLGQQRVKAAVPALIELFRKQVKVDGPGVRVIGEALARIGDPAAVPILLDDPYWRDGDVVGDTSDALGAFGKLAYPYCEERIRSWRSELAGRQASRVWMCLRLLGTNGSEATVQATLELVDELAKQVVSPTDIKASVLLAGVTAIAPKHPAEVVNAIWATREKPDTCLFLIRDFYQLPPAVSKFIAMELRRRSQGAPDVSNQIRLELMRTLVWTAPEILAAEKSAISSKTEAHHLLEMARGRRLDSTLRLNVARRAEAFLRDLPDPEVRLDLAVVYYNLKEFERCETLITEALTGLKEKGNLSRAYFYRGEARMRRGEIVAGQNDLREALELYDQYHAYESITRDAIERRLKEAATFPRVEGLKVREHWINEVDSWNDIDGYVEIAAGRAFYLDGIRRLMAWDPIKQAGVEISVMSQVVRDFMPLDQRRVFVAFEDGTAALYEEGRDRPVWIKSFSLGFNCYLSASPQAITAADEEGNLHLIDPTTGKTLWTRKVRGAPWPQSWWQGHRGLIEQRGERVLIPDDADSPPHIFDWVDLSTGKTLWSYQPKFAVHRVAVGTGLLVFVGDSGKVVAISLEDGSVRWEKQMRAASDPHLTFALAIDNEGDSVYLAIADTLWSLSVSSGEVVWHWQRTPRAQVTQSPQRSGAWPLLCPTNGAIYFLLNWEYSKTTDVVLLTKAGKLLFKATSPVTVYSPSSAANPFVQGQTLVFRKTWRWQVWEFSELQEK